MTHTIALVSKAVVILVLFCDVREREQEQRKEKLCHSEEWEQVRDGELPSNLRLRKALEILWVELSQKSIIVRPEAWWHIPLILTLER